jgi:hypothetical protein
MICTHHHNIIQVSKSRSMRWVGQATHMGERGGAYSIWGEPEGKRSLGRSTYRWKHYVKMDLHDVGWVHGPN